MVEISVIVTTVNRPKDVKILLVSIEKQDYNKIFQILLIDQSNNEKTKKIFNERIKKDNKKKIIYTYIKNKELKGLTNARNLGVKSALGKILVFLDDDSFIPQNYLLTTEHVFKESEKKVAAVGASINSKIKKNYLFHNMFYRGCYGKHCNFMKIRKYKKPVKVNFMSGGSMAIRKSVIRKILFDEKLNGYSLGEDIEISLRLRKKGYKILLNPYTFVEHNETSINRKHREDYITNRVYNNYYIFEKNVNKNIYNIISFGLVFLSISIRSIKLSFINKSIKPIKDFIKGIKKVRKHIKANKIKNIYEINWS